MALLVRFVALVAVLTLLAATVRGDDCLDCVKGGDCVYCVEKDGFDDVFCQCKTRNANEGEEAFCKRDSNASSVEPFGTRLDCRLGTSWSETIVGLTIFFGITFLPTILVRSSRLCSKIFKLCFGSSDSEPPVGRAREEYDTQATRREKFEFRGPSGSPQAGRGLPDSVHASLVSLASFPSSPQPAGRTTHSDYSPESVQFDGRTQVQRSSAWNKICCSRDLIQR